MTEAMVESKGTVGDDGKGESGASATTYDTGIRVDPPRQGIDGDNVICGLIPWRVFQPVCGGHLGP